MDKEELLEKIRIIVKDHAGDDEAQHSREDNLHLELIEAYCPEWVKDEINKLSDADFARWCA